jgi:hypothetical protein
MRRVSELVLLKDSLIVKFVPFPCQSDLKNVRYFDGETYLSRGTGISENRLPGSPIIFFIRRFGTVLSKWLNLVYIIVIERNTR